MKPRILIASLAFVLLALAWREPIAGVLEAGEIAPLASTEMETQLAPPDDTLERIRATKVESGALRADFDSGRTDPAVRDFAMRGRRAARASR
jgi:hypothetical protein